MTDAKNNQEKLKSDLGEIKKGNDRKKSKEQKTFCTILKCFIKQEMKLLSFMLIILQLSQKQKLKQLKEKYLKY